MSSNITVKLNLAGINELMKSPEIQASLEYAGEAVAAAAGEGYETRSHVINWVAVTNVYPATREAAQDNYRNNTLQKAIGAVGLPVTK